MLVTYSMKILRPANLPARWDSVSDARSRLWRTRCCANLQRRLGEDSLALLALCCSLKSATLYSFVEVIAQTVSFGMWVCAAPGERTPTNPPC